VIARDRVVVQMPLQHPLAPRSGCRDGVVHTLAQLHLDGLELGLHPLLDRFAADDKRAPLAGSRAEVGKDLESPTFRAFPLPDSHVPWPRGGQSDQPGLVWVQRQFKRAQSLVQVVQESLCLMLVFEADDLIVSGLALHL